MNYSLENVEKFIRDNSSIIGNRAEGILERASALAVRGIISKSSTYEIMQDNFFTEEFHLIVFLNVDHIKIGAAVIAKNAEEDRGNALSENMSKALALIFQARVLIGKDQEHIDDARKYLARACYEALDAVCYAISKEEISKEDKQGSEYVSEHLFKAILGFCDYYATDMTDTLVHSGYFTNGVVKLLSDHGWTKMPKNET